MFSEQELIDFICWDRRLLSVPSFITEAPCRDIILLYPSMRHRNYAAFIRKRIIEDAKKQGVLSESQLIKEAIASGAWSIKNEELYNKSEERLTELNSLLSKEKISLKKRKLSKDIENLKIHIASLRAQRINITMASYDYLANEQQIYYLVQKLTCDFNGDNIWENDISFYDQKNLYTEFITWIANQIVSEGLLPVKDIRRVARSGVWRLIWTSAKDNVECLFKNKLYDITTNQKYLIYWSKIYDSIYEDPDRPGEEIIQDDEAIDAWLNDRSEKRTTKNTSSTKGVNKAIENHAEVGVMMSGYYNDDCTCGANKNPKKGLGEAPIHSNGCQYGIYIEYTKEEKEELARQIYNRNSAPMRQLMNKEQELVEKRGEMQEHNLRTGTSRHLLSQKRLKK